MTGTRRKQSAVNLTASAFAVLVKYRNAYSVKHLLSVGLELFDLLDQKEQFQRITASKVADTVARRAEGDALKIHKKQRRSPPKAVG